jgi:hypothetical protein
MQDPHLPHSDRKKRLDTRHLGLYAASAVVGLGAVGAAELAGAPAAYASTTTNMLCGANSCFTLGGPIHFSYADVAIAQTGHQLCLYYNSNASGGCTAGSATNFSNYLSGGVARTATAHTRLYEDVTFDRAYVYHY